MYVEPPTRRIRSILSRPFSRAWSRTFFVAMMVTSRRLAVMSSNSSRVSSTCERSVPCVSRVVLFVRAVSDLLAFSARARNSCHDSGELINCAGFVPCSSQNLSANHVATSSSQLAPPRS